MRATLARTDFLRALQAVDPWVPGRTPLTAWKHVKARSLDRTRVEFSAACQEGTARIEVVAEVLEEGELLIMPDPSIEAAKKSRADGVQISPATALIHDPSWVRPKIKDTDEKSSTFGKMIEDPSAKHPIIESDGGCKLKIGPNQYTWPGPRAELHTGFQGDLSGARFVTTPCAAFVRAATAALSAIERKESQTYALTGVLMERHGPRLRLVATDGHLVAIQDLEAEWGEALDAIPEGTVIDGKGLGKIVAAIATEGDSVGAMIEFRFPEQRRGHISATVGGLTATVRLLEKRFPAYQLSDKNLGDPVLTIPLKQRAKWLEFVKSAAIGAPDDKSGIEVEFTGKGEVIIWADGPETGLAVMTQVSGYQGDPFGTGFRPSHFIAAVEGCPWTESAPGCIHFYGHHEAIKIEAPFYSYLIMANISSRVPRTPELRERMPKIEPPKPKKERKKKAS